MAEFKPFLCIFRVFNPHNYRGSRCNILSAICRALCIITFLVMQAMMSILVIWHWMQSSSGFNSLAISTCIVGIQMLGSNTAMIRNNWEIADTLNSVQMAVDSRKNSRFFDSSVFVVVHSLSFDLIVLGNRFTSTKKRTYFGL